MEEELKQAQEKIVALETELIEIKTTNENLTKDLTSKDETITALKLGNEDMSRNFKKLRDMTKEEKELLSEKEIEIMARQEKLEEERAKDKEERDAFNKKQKNALIDNIAMKYAKGNKELADKIKVNLGKLKIVESLETEQELMPEVEFAFNALGVKTSPDPLNMAHNQGGGAGNTNIDNSFAETAEGKSLAGALGLQQAKVDTNNNNK